MSGFEQLEKELRSLRPDDPSVEFEVKVEQALGDSGRLAVSQLPDLDSEASLDPPPKSKNLVLAGFSLVGLAAVIFFALFPSGQTDTGGEAGLQPALPSRDSVPSASVTKEDDSSPLHGVSSEELSLTPANGWSEPWSQEILLEVSDEGVVERPGMPPARKYRYQYLDETIWTNSGANTFMRSSTPRQEVLLIGLEPLE